MLDQVWRMRCEKCSAPISLPRRSPIGIPEHPRDQPKGTWSINVLCRHCDQWFGYTALDVRLERIELPAQGQLSDTLWHGAFECAREGCGRLIEIYATAESFFEAYEVQTLLLNAIPAITCSQGHQLSKEAVIRNLSPVKRMTNW